MWNNYAEWSRLPNFPGVELSGAYCNCFRKWYMRLFFFSKHKSRAENVFSSGKTYLLKGLYFCAPKILAVSLEILSGEAVCCFKDVHFTGSVGPQFENFRSIIAVWSFVWKTKRPYLMRGLNLMIEKICQKLRILAKAVGFGRENLRFLQKLQILS